MTHSFGSKVTDRLNNQEPWSGSRTKQILRNYFSVLNYVFPGCYGFVFLIPHMTLTSYVWKFAVIISLQCCIEHTLDNQARRVWPLLAFTSVVLQELWGKSEHFPRDKLHWKHWKRLCCIQLDLKQYTANIWWPAPFMFMVKKCSEADSYRVYEQEDKTWRIRSVCGYNAKVISPVTS